MNANDAIETLVGQLLRSVPETWADLDPPTLSALQEQTLFLLTASGMIERRVTFRLRMAAQPDAVEATISITGEGGLAQAMQFLIKETWNDWREGFENQRGDDSDDTPRFHCERVGSEQWRLTPEGVMARSDLDNGNTATVIDFVLKKGSYDGKPRMLLVPHPFLIFG